MDGNLTPALLSQLCQSRPNNLECYRAKYVRTTNTNTIHLCALKSWQNGQLRQAHGTETKKI